MPEKEVMIINGWTLYWHPCFLEQLEELRNKVAKLKNKDPVGYIEKNDTKRLAAIYKLIFDIIPSDPTSSIYRQGDTLGDENKHWFRAKFFQQYRLFFRYHKDAKVIVYAWVNDEKQKRAYGSKSDAYAVFKKMLEKGRPPGSWDDLLKRSESISNSKNSGE